MSVEELIEQLNKIEDKTMIVYVPELWESPTSPIEEVCIDADGVNLFSV